MSLFTGRTRLATILAIGVVLLVVGIAVGAAGEALIVGSANYAGSSDTYLTTTSAGNTLVVTQGGSGAAIRASTGSGTGIAGVFTSSRGSALSSIVANANGYAVYAANAGAEAGKGVAIRADGQRNVGILATSEGTAAIQAYATSCEGLAPPCAGYGIDAKGSGFGGAVHGDGTGSLAGLWANEGALAGVYSTVTGPDVPGVHAESVGGTAVVGVGANGGPRQDLPAAGGEFLGTYGVIGQTDSAYGAGVFGTTTIDSGQAIYSDGDAYIDGDLGMSGVCTGCTTAIVAVNGSSREIRQGEAVAVRGVRTAADGSIVAVVAPANRGDRVVGIADRALTLSPESATTGGIRRTIMVPGGGPLAVTSPESTFKLAYRTWELGDVAMPAASHLRVITSGMFAYQPVAALGLTAGDQLAVGSTVGRLTRAGPSAARGTIAGTFLGSLGDGRVVLLVRPI